MTFILKVIIFFAILYWFFRLITKPFRDFLKQFQGEVRQMNDLFTERNQQPKSKTENIGEYIDYEEID